jgi:hypothetical protein
MGIPFSIFVLLLRVQTMEKEGSNNSMYRERSSSIFLECRPQESPAARLRLIERCQQDDFEDFQVVEAGTPNSCRG